MPGDYHGFLLDNEKCFLQHDLFEVDNVNSSLLKMSSTEQKVFSDLKTSPLRCLRKQNAGM